MQLGTNIGIVMGRIVERFNALVEASPLIGIRGCNEGSLRRNQKVTLNNFIGHLHEWSSIAS